MDYQFALGMFSGIAIMFSALVAVLFVTSGATDNRRPNDKGGKDVWL